MCIFTGVVEPIVSATKIFVAMLSLSAQLTVYQNNVQTAGNVAMILPVPNPLGSGVTMVDLSGYRTFFDDLQADLPNRPRFQTLSFGSLSSHANEPAPVLAIQRVGAYDVSVAGTLDDLLRLDWSHFALMPHVVDVLKEHYAKDFAFVVARLRESATPHPLAYIHNPFNEHSMFVPTRHEGHTVRKDPLDAMLDKRGGKSVFGKPREKELVLWDHTIFAYHTYSTYYKDPHDLAFDRRQGNETRFVNMHKLQHAITRVDPLRKLISPTFAWFHRKDIHGLRENCDVTFTIEKAPDLLFTGEFPFFPLADQNKIVVALGLVIVCIIVYMLNR